MGADTVLYQMGEYQTGSMSEVPAYFYLIQPSLTGRYQHLLDARYNRCSSLLFFMKSLTALLAHFSFLLWS